MDRLNSSSRVLFLFVITVTAVVLFFGYDQNFHLSRLNRENTSKPEGFTNSRDEIAKDIKRRRMLVRKFCAKHQPDLSQVNELIKSRKLYVDDKHKFIYCHMPKTASSTWLRILLSLRNYDRNEIHQRSHVLSIANYTRKQALYRLNNYFKFLFVREPFERLLSAYKDKIIGERNSKKYLEQNAPLLVQEFRRQRTAISKGAKSEVPFISFPEFINYYISNSSSQKFASRSLGMWSSAVTVCKPCLVHYDFIGHYETLKRDADFVLRKCDIDKQATFPPWTPSNTAKEVYQYHKQISPRKRETVYEILKDDYEMFGYTSVFND